MGIRTLGGHCHLMSNLVEKVKNWFKKQDRPVDDPDWLYPPVHRVVAKDEGCDVLVRMLEEDPSLVFSTNACGVCDFVSIIVFGVSDWLVFSTFPCTLHVKNIRRNMPNCC